MRFFTFVSTAVALVTTYSIFLNLTDASTLNQFPNDQHLAAQVLADAYLETTWVVEEPPTRAEALANLGKAL